VIAGQGDGTLVVWDLEQGIPTETLSLGHGAAVTAVVGKGSELVSGDADGVLAHFVQDRCVARRPGHRGAVTAIAALPHGYVSIGTDGRLIVWDEALRWRGEWTCAEALHALQVTGELVRVGDAAGRVHEVHL
jgi:WD40 repeat protein